jgi:hypothetical protein
MPGLSAKACGIAMNFWQVQISRSRICRTMAKPNSTSNTCSGSVADVTAPDLRRSRASQYLGLLGRFDGQNVRRVSDVARR